MLLSAMPKLPAWYLRVPEILGQLRTPGAPPFLGRTAVETLFRVSRRQAIPARRRPGISGRQDLSGRARISHPFPRERGDLRGGAGCAGSHTFRGQRLERTR